MVQAIELGTEQPSLFQDVTALRKQGKTAEALQRLRDCLRRGRMEPEAVERAGRLIRKELDRLPAGFASEQVLLLGQCTTSWLATSLVAVAWGRGAGLIVTDGEYDNIMQSLMTPGQQDAQSGAVVFLPWVRRLLSADGKRSARQRVDDEVAFWLQAWELATNRLGARIVQVGYDCMVPGALGHHLGGAGAGDMALVRQLNEALRQALPEGGYFVDLDSVAGEMGRSRFYDPRRYFWTKQPFSEAGTVRLADHVWAGLRAVTTGPKKVLVLDLDNTLWGGVVGETGPLGIGLGESPDGEAFLAFQRHVKELSNRGVVLAVSSKNNPKDARGPFESNPSMALSLSDFAQFEASWAPKPAALKRIAESLRLGLDGFVFFDDNPAEREFVRQALPEVEVVDVPEDPAEYIRALQAGLWFESAALTKADAERAQQYQQENQRQKVQAASVSLEDYLRSLEMRAEVRPVDEADFQRVVQLIGKTNQFNLTTRRHGPPEVRRLLDTPGALGLTLRVSDRHGDYGLVSIILAEPLQSGPPSTLRLDTWLMSCRVISRTVEHYFFNALVDQARALGYQFLVGEYCPTSKNTQVADIYDRLGFSRLPDTGDGTNRYQVAVDQVRLAETFVRDSP